MKGIPRLPTPPCRVRRVVRRSVEPALKGPLQRTVPRKPDLNASEDRSLMKQSCKEKEPYIGPDATLIEAARQMKLLDVATLSVCENGRLIGTVSNADVTFRAVAKCLNHNTATVREVMTTDAVYCFDDQNVCEAGRIMTERQMRRLPVVNHQKRFLGMISLGDLALCARKNKLAREVLAFRRSWSASRGGMFRAAVPA